MRKMLLFFVLYSFLGAVTLQELVKDSIENGYKIQEKISDLRAVHIQSIASYLVFMPRVNVNYDYNISINNDKHSSYINTALNLNILNGLQDYHLVQKIQKDKEIANFSLDSAKNDLALQIKATYINILQLKESIRVSQDSIKLLENQLKQARSFYNQGISDKSSVLTVEVKLANAQVEKLNSDAAINYNLQVLNKLTGKNLKTEELEDINFKDDEYNLDLLIGNIYSQNSNLQMANINFSKTNSELNAVRFNILPKIDLSISRFFSITGDERMLPKAQLKFSINIPIVNMYSYFSDLEVKKAQIISASSKISDLKQDLKDNLIKLLNDLKLAKNNLNVAKITIQQAEENYRIINNKYKQNISTYTDLLDAELLLSNAKSRLINAKYAIYLSQAKIEHLKNLY